MLVTSVSHCGMPQMRKRWHRITRANATVKQASGAPGPKIGIGTRLEYSPCSKKRMPREIWRPLEGEGEGEEGASVWMKMLVAVVAVAVVRERVCGASAGLLLRLGNLQRGEAMYLPGSMSLESSLLRFFFLFFFNSSDARLLFRTSVKDGVGVSTGGAGAAERRLRGGWEDGCADARLSSPLTEGVTGGGVMRSQQGGRDRT